MLDFKLQKSHLLRFAMVVVVAFLFLGACSSSSQDTDRAQRVVMGYTQFPANIDPAKEYNGWFTVRYGVGETLFRMNDQLAVEPWLATQGKQLSDLEWEITLREGVSFQNGESMTAEKVKQSLERLIANNQRAEKDLAIEQIRANGQILRVRTKTPQPILLNLLAEPYSTIMDVDGEEATGKSIVGTGPYILREFRPENGARLVANEHYWAGAVQVKEVEIRSFADPTSMSLALEAGEIDAAYGLPSANLALYRGNTDYRISEAAGSRFLAYVYNFRDRWMKDQVLRNAVDLVIDRRAYSDSLFRGATIPAVGAFPSSFSFALEGEARKASLKEAEAVLDQAGYEKHSDGYRYKDGEKVVLTALSYERLPEIPLAVQATQAELKSVGIELVIKPVEVGAIATEEDYSFTPYTMVAAPVGDPYPFFSGSLASDGAVNLGHYQNAQVDKAIQQLAIETEPARRDALSQQIQEQVESDQAFSFIATFKTAVIMNAHVSGLQSSPSDYYHITNHLAKG